MVASPIRPLSGASMRPSDGRMSSPVPSPSPQRVPDLPRVLGASHATAIVVGTIIGSGIFPARRLAQLRHFAAAGERREPLHPHTRKPASVIITAAAEGGPP